VTMGWRHIGHNDAVAADGGGTVKIGRRVDAEMGGWTVLRGRGVSAFDRVPRFPSRVFSLRTSAAFCSRPSPEMIGGGNTSPSVAFRDSCRAKSEACHHSRNLSAKMEAGSR